jgi:peroxiredoxin
MTALTPVLPRQQAPGLEVPLVGGGTWNLADQSPENFTLVVMYRGRHCPICSMYLADLQTQLGAFEERGVNVITLSSDTLERAEDARQEWKLDKLTLGYGLDLDTARKWGLYISTGRGITGNGIVEPDLFAEPGLFLVRPDNTIYFATVQTMPFARPHFADIVKAIDFVVAKDYPARGEVIDHTAVASAAE